tara:strand:+ start:358 stop:663 length:306 start_codon:yes stop_codon:yes gene_type:complete
MEQSSQKGNEEVISKNSSSNDLKKQKAKAKQSKNNNSKERKSSDGEVLLSLPGGFKYQLPGKRQRLVLGSIVIGLNVLLVIAVAVYFYSPSFQSFVYNFGR